MAGGNRLHAADYAVLAVMLGVSMAIGLYYACRGGKQRTTSEFLMADRKLKVRINILLILICKTVCSNCYIQMWT